MFSRLRTYHILLSMVLLLSLAMASCHSSKKAVSGYVPTPTPGPTVPPTTGNTASQALLDEAFGWLGTPYVFGGKTKKGTDCSGFTMEVFRKALDIQIPRNSARQGEFCKDVKRSDMIAGDLVFFNTGGGKRISHVGIYIGDGYIIHASSHGVMVSSLDEPYYRRTYHHSGRVTAFADMMGKKSKNPTKNATKNLKSKDKKPATPLNPTGPSLGPTLTPTLSAPAMLEEPSAEELIFEELMEQAVYASQAQASNAGTPSMQTVTPAPSVETGSTAGTVAPKTAETQGRNTSTSTPQADVGRNEANVGAPTRNSNVSQPDVGTLESDVGTPAPDVGVAQPDVGVAQPDVGPGNTTVAKNIGVSQVQKLATGTSHPNSRQKTARHH